MGREFAMNRALVLCGAFTLVCVASSAQAAFKVWQGDLFITAVNNQAACAAVNMNVGDFARGVFRPKSVAGNGRSDLLAWYFGRSAGQIAPASALNAATSATVRIIYGSAGFLQFNNAVLSGVTVNPAAPTTSTPTVTITVTAHDVYSSSTTTPSGCDITFTGTLAKRPI
jgi:hypothetical protein